jgi:signal peptidase I
MSHLLQLMKVVFKPFNTLIASSIIIVGLATALYLINPYRVNSDSVRARIFGVDIYRIPSKSMEPGLVPGDYIFVSNIAYQNVQPQVKDVIVFYDSNAISSSKKVAFIKRIVAMSGDKIKIVKGKVYVNGVHIQEPYVQESQNNSQYSQFMVETMIPSGELFVLGDNRDNSNDSRIFGAVSSKGVIGKATNLLYGSNGRSGNEIK